MAGLQRTLIALPTDTALSQDLTGLSSRCLVNDTARSAVASSSISDLPTRPRILPLASSASRKKHFLNCNSFPSNVLLLRSYPLACAALTSAPGEAVLVDEDSRQARSRGSLRVISDAFLEDAVDDILSLARVRVQDGSFARAREVLQFLLQLWITKKGLRTIATEHPKILTLKLHDLTHRTQYFFDRGFSPAEVGSAIVRDASWLFVPVQQIQGVTVYLEATGLSPDKIPKLLLKHPAILRLDLENTVDSTVDYLGSLVGPAGSLQRVLERQPGVLQLSDSDIAERTAVMARFGLSATAISNLVFIKPSILLLEPEVLSDRFEYLQTIFLRRRLPNIFKVAPSLLCVAPDRIHRQFMTLKEYLGPEVAERTVNSFPQALSLNWERVLLPKLEYLQELGLEPSEVVNFPAYLGYSLPERIRPRCEILLKEGFSIAPHSKVIGSDADRKLRKFGQSHREILSMEGFHHVCIQHIVGLREEEFEEQFFEVHFGHAPMRLRQLRGMQFDEKDTEELDELEDEVLGDGSVSS